MLEIMRDNFLWSYGMTKGMPRPGSMGIPRPSASDTKPMPMPVTRSPGRDLPNGMATFTKEIRPPARMSPENINPGKK